MEDTEFVPFDLETGSVDRLWTSEKGTFVKLVGIESSVFTKPGYVNDALGIGSRLVGHNNFFFDSIVLARHHGIPVEKTIPGARDLRIAAFQNDPPTSYQTQSGPGFKSYSLDALGERYCGMAKSGALKSLEKIHGSYEAIPNDDPKFRQYLRDDLALTEAVDKAIPWDPYEEREARVCAITARATLEGFRVDVPGLEKRAQDLAEQSRRGKQMLFEVYGFPLMNKAGKPAAAPQRTILGKAAFETALEASGFPTDRWPRGKDRSLSLSKETMAFALGHAEAFVPAAVSIIRAVSDMNGIRNNAANVLRYTVGDRVHPAFLPFQATGRWSILEPGLTVLKKGVEDSEREFLLPDEPGQYGENVLVSIDLDQIDIRCVAAHSQDHNLIDILNDPARDFHQEIADLANVSRYHAKSQDLGWLYGRTVNGLAKTPGMTLESAVAVDRSMRERFGRVMDWQRHVRAMGEEGVLLDNGFGRKLRIDPERAFTQAPGFVGQGTTRDLIAEGLLTLQRVSPDVIPMIRVIVHDEIVASIPKRWANDIAKLIQDCMSREWAPAGKSRPVRITAGQGKPFKFGTTWGELYR